MTANNTRREFIRTSAAGLILPATARAVEPKANSINVVVWDKRLPVPSTGVNMYKTSVTLIRDKLNFLTKQDRRSRLPL